MTDEALKQVLKGVKITDEEEEMWLIVVIKMIIHGFHDYNISDITEINVNQIKELRENVEFVKSTRHKKQD